MLSGRDAYAPGLRPAGVGQPAALDPLHVALRVVAEKSRITVFGSLLTVLQGVLRFGAF